MIPGWMKKANCVGTDPEAWFPGKGGRVTSVQRRICGECQVQECCLIYALNNTELRGIWGGLTESQRREIVRERGKRPTPWPDTCVY